MLFKRTSISRSATSTQDEQPDLPPPPCMPKAGKTKKSKSTVDSKSDNNNNKTTSKRPRSKPFTKSNSSWSLASGDTAATSLSSDSTTSLSSKKSTKTKKSNSSSSKSSKKTSSTPIPKSVRFNETMNQYHADKKRKNLVKDCRKTWYSDEDYAVMRDNLKILVSKTKIRLLDEQKQQQQQQRQQEQDDHQEENATTTNKASPLHFVTSLEGLLRKTKTVNYVLDNASQIPKLSNKKLSKLYLRKFGGGIELIGLEHYLSATLFLDAKERRESVQELVAVIQTEHQQGLWTDAEALRLEFRNCCRQVTQAHVLMAQLLAQAQYNLPAAA